MTTHSETPYLLTNFRVHHIDQFISRLVALDLESGDFIARFARSVSHLLRALETFNALGIQFVSLSEQVDTSTPTGKMVFTILGAVAELERNLIVERVRAGLRHARAKGKRLGRPRKAVDVDRINSLRAAGHSWRSIAAMMKLSVGTVYAAARSQNANARCALGTL
jgi:DNA invertase Pin-like site-specific DNA recombinase